MAQDLLLPWLNCLSPKLFSYTTDYIFDLEKKYGSAIQAVYFQN